MADNVAITAGTGTSIAADDISSVWYQRIKRSVGADGSATDFLDKASRSDTFTGTANGTTVDVSAQGMTQFAIQVKGTGASATSWTVVLEGSLDGTNFVTICTHQNGAVADGGIQFSGATLYPVLYFRSRCTALSLGSATNVVATILGK